MTTSASADAKSALALDPFAVGHFTLVDADREPALRVGADPDLEDHRAACLPVIRQRDHRPIPTLLALRKMHRRRGPHPRPTKSSPLRSSRWPALPAVVVTGPRRGS